MTRSGRPRLLLPLLVGVVAAVLAAAPAQTDCPPQSRAPHCAAEPDEADARTTEPGDRPATPPGQAPEPRTSEPQPERTDPRPDHGTDDPPPASGPAPEDAADAAPPVTGPRATTPDAPTSAPGRPVPPTTGDRPGGTVAGAVEGTDDEATGTPIPPPPPDLGARRILTTRLMSSLDGRSVAVGLAVEEARAHGVDGGWTVTVTGPSHGAVPALAFDARASRPDGDVGLIVGRAHGDAGAMGFTVVGQRSTTVYDATYLGMLPVGPFPEGTPPVITVTLFQ